MNGSPLSRSSFFHGFKDLIESELSFSSKRIFLNQASRAISNRSSFSSRNCNSLHFSSNLALRFVATPGYFFEPNTSTLTSSRLANNEFSLGVPASTVIFSFLYLFTQAAESAFPLKDGNSFICVGGLGRGLMPPKLISKSESSASALVAAATASLIVSGEGLFNDIQGQLVFF